MKEELHKRRMEQKKNKTSKQAMISESRNN
jgi:hypothetical protein